MNPGAGQFILYQLAEERTMEKVALELVLAGYIGFCKEWGMETVGRGKRESKDRATGTCRMCLAEYE